VLGLHGLLALAVARLAVELVSDPAGILAMARSMLPPGNPARLLIEGHYTAQLAGDHQHAGQATGCLACHGPGSVAAGTKAGDGDGREVLDQAAQAGRAAP